MGYLEVFQVNTIYFIQHYKNRDEYLIIGIDF